VSLDDEAADEVRELARLHRLRVPRIVDRTRGPMVVLDGHEVVNLRRTTTSGLIETTAVVGRASTAWPSPSSHDQLLRSLGGSRFVK
jgi:hypothetical protein